jgi:type IV secretory pathway TrbD component
VPEDREDWLHVVHPSLYRPVLFAGVEFGVLVLEASTVLGLLFVIGVHVGTVLLAIGYACGVHTVAAGVTAHDPQISQVYLRSLFLRDYYPPHATVSLRAATVRDAVPRIR